MFSINSTQLLPEACITVKKSRLKLYNSSNYYLKDKSNFEIELFNPTSEDVLAKIWINGLMISAAGIVIPANQRVFLERFIENANKFQYNVYEVDDVEETSNARTMNGRVKVSFFRLVKTRPRQILLTDNFGNTSFQSTTTIPISNYNYNNPIPSYAGYSCHTPVSTNNSSPVLRTTGFLACTDQIETVETGRIAEGAKSSQEFGKAYGEYENHSFVNYEYHILPTSLKPVQATEIREYCTQCGIRIRKSSWKYCPTCGNSL